MTDKTKEVLRLALRALEYIDLTDNDRDFLQPHECYMLDEAITAIRSALALVNKVDQEESSGTEQPAQKEYTSFSEWAHDYVQDNLHKLKPAQRKPWMSLTDDEAIFLIENELLGRGDLIDAIEAKLKAKNSP